MASNDTYIFAENFSANSSESLRLSGFPVTKSVRDLKTEIVRQGGARYSAEDITITFGSQELSDRKYRRLVTEKACANKSGHCSR